MATIIQRWMNDKDREFHSDPGINHNGKDHEKECVCIYSRTTHCKHTQHSKSLYFNKRNFKNVLSIKYCSSNFMTVLVKSAAPLF